MKPSTKIIISSAALYAKLIEIKDLDHIEYIFYAKNKLYFITRTESEDVYTIECEASQDAKFYDFDPDWKGLVDILSRVPEQPVVLELQNSGINLTIHF